MTKYDVIIIGAGPSGIFCAYELIKKKPELKVLMLEKGRRIENRECPKRRTKECVGCQPCAITTGFADSQQAVRSAIPYATYNKTIHNTG